jgi:hypothetical protein
MSLVGDRALCTSRQPLLDAAYVLQGEGVGLAKLTPGYNRDPRRAPTT